MEIAYEIDTSRESFEKTVEIISREVQIPSSKRHNATFDEKDLHSSCMHLAVSNGYAERGMESLAVVLGSSRNRCFLILSRIGLSIHLCVDFLYFVSASLATHSSFSSRASNILLIFIFLQISNLLLPATTSKKRVYRPHYNVAEPHFPHQGGSTVYFAYIIATKLLLSGVLERRILLASIYSVEHYVAALSRRIMC